ncbi:MAG: AraC family ligand binding domain-containing protein [Candidatus Firestonebacteria bacterium]
MSKSIQKYFTLQYYFKKPFDEMRILGGCIGAIDKGKKVPYHKHSFYEVHYISEGKLFLEVNNNQYILGEGMLYLIPPEILHFQKALSKVKYCYLSYNISSVNFRNLPFKKRELFVAIAPQESKILKIEKGISNLFQEIINVTDKRIALNKTMKIFSYIKNSIDLSMPIDSGVSPKFR